MPFLASVVARLLSALLVAVAVALLATGMLGWLGDVAGTRPLAVAPAATQRGQLPSADPRADATDGASTPAPARTLRPVMPSSGATDPPPPSLAPDPTVTPTVDPTRAPDPTAEPDRTPASDPT